MRFRPCDGEDVGRAVAGIGYAFPPTLRLTEHQHRRDQFLYAGSGVITVDTARGLWVSPPRHGIWIPAGTLHSVRMVDAARNMSALIEPTACLRPRIGCEVIEISALLHELIAECTDVPVEYDEDGRDGALMKLLIIEIEQAARMPFALPLPQNPLLADLCHAFLSRPQASATIDQWADKLLMSRRSFTRMFRRETGMSFVDWRQQACLSIALPRLAAGESVERIALGLGYERLGSFSAMCKRALGLSPSRYRH